MLRALFLFLSIALFGRSEETWQSTALGTGISMTVLEPTSLRSSETRGENGDAASAKNSAALPVIVYLEGLAAKRVGTESDETILRDFRADGFLVITLDYGHRPQARWPLINRDLVALREQIQKKTFLQGRALDTKHIFIVPSGHRLKRDVPFYQDGKRTLAFDVIYPSRPSTAVGTILEFSCDNQDRMSNFSLNFCTDTLLEGAATEGFAVAMADHPVAAPYAGIDAMPDCAWKTKSAVRTLRAESKALGLTGTIVPVGFSRGSGMALLLLTTSRPSKGNGALDEAKADFDLHGEHLGVSSAVQGAVILSGRFTYLDLLPNDHMIPRYNKVWGTQAEHETTWRAHGALDYLTGRNEPCFLSINCTESPDALHQMEVLRKRLAELHSPFEYQLDEEPRGHRVPLTPAVLNPMMAYLKRQLGDPSPEGSK